MRAAYFARRIALGVTALTCAVAFGQEDESLIVDLGEGQVLELVHLSPGTFAQGSPAAEPQRGADETQRPVTLTRAFFLGKYPVTRGQFARFAADTGYLTQAEKGASGGLGWDGTQFVQHKDFNWENPGFAQTDEDPVTLVTHNDTRAFLAWLSQRSGRAFSLPSEAQWEYACRASSTTAFAHGADSARLPAFAWFRRNSGGGTRNVGEKPLNAWGLGDMAGHVREWCADWYAPYRPVAAADPLRTEPNLPETPRRVLRGGSWARDAAACRAAARSSDEPSSRSAEYGFRVMTFDPAPPPIPPAVARASDPQSAPSTKASPAATESSPLSPAPSAPRGMSTLRLALTLAAIGAAAIFLIQLLRQYVSGGGVARYRVRAARVRGSSTRLRTRIVEDGFWVESSALPDGTTLDCHYTIDGWERHKMITFRAGPRGQFVPTGSRPEHLAVNVHPGSLPQLRSTRDGAAL